MKMIKYQYLFLPGQYLIGTHGSNTELGKQEFSYRLISYLHVQIAFVREYACTRLTNVLSLPGNTLQGLAGESKISNIIAITSISGILNTTDTHTHTHVCYRN